MSQDPLVQQQARQSIIFECEGHAGLSASPEYGTLYATLLAKALQPAAASPSIRIRLNAAVVADHVAFDVYREGGSASGLEPLVKKLLKDPDEAVVLWGIKAARYVIASDLLSATGPSSLGKAVVQAVKSFPGSGSIVEDAYQSLTPQDDARPNAPGIPPAAAATVLPDLNDLMTWRGDQYKAGGSPPSPLADIPATVFIPVKVFPVIQANPNPAALKKTLQAMGDATCSTLRFLANGTPTPELVQMVNAYGDAFDTIGQEMSNDDIHKAGIAIEKMSQNTDPTRISKLCDDLANALKSVGVNLANGNGPGAAEPAAPAAVAGSAK